MGIDEIVEFADQVVQSQTGFYLTDLQKSILRGALRGEKYGDIAIHANVSEFHLRDEGAKLWQLLSRGLGEKVTKTNFREALQRQFRLSQEQATSTQQVTANQFPQWVGRSAEIAKLQELVADSTKILMIVGEGGIGKTTLAEKFVADCNIRCIKIKVALSPDNLSNIESELQFLLQQEFNEDTPREFTLCLRLLLKKLHQDRVIVFIDNLETALHNGKFLPQCQNYIELLRVLSAPEIRGFTIITSRERLNEPQIRDIQVLQLNGLTFADWQQFFHQPTSAEDLAALEEMHHSHDGNAQAM